MIGVPGNRELIQPNQLKSLLPQETSSFEFNTDLMDRLLLVASSDFQYFLKNCEKSKDVPGFMEYPNGGARIRQNVLHIYQIYLLVFTLKDTENKERGNPLIYYATSLLQSSIDHLEEAATIISNLPDSLTISERTIKENNMINALSHSVIGSLLVLLIIGLREYLDNLWVCEKMVDILIKCTIALDQFNRQCNVIKDFDKRMNDNKRRESHTFWIWDLELMLSYLTSKSCCKIIEGLSESEEEEKVGKILKSIVFSGGIESENGNDTESENDGEIVLTNKKIESEFLENIKTNKDNITNQLIDYMKPFMKTSPLMMLKPTPEIEYPYLSVLLKQCDLWGEAYQIVKEINHSGI